MKIEIEYPVITTGTPLRTNKERTVILKDKATFDVPEYHASEASVGVRWEYRRNTHSLRVINGQLFEPIATRQMLDRADYWQYIFKFQIFEGFGFKSLAPQAPLEFNNNSKLIRLREEAGTKLSTSVFPPDVADVVASRTDFQMLSFRNEIELRNIAEEGFFTAKSQMESAVSNLALIDGNLWRRCLPPMLTTTCGTGLNGWHSLKHEVRVRPYYEDFRHVIESIGGVITTIHSLAEGDIASHQLGTVLTDHGFNLQRPYLRDSVDLNSIEVLESDVTEFPSADYRVLHVADLMVNAVGSHLTQKMSSIDEKSSPSHLLRRNLERLGTHHLVHYKNLIDNLDAAFFNKAVDENLVNSMASIDEQFFGYLDRHRFPGFAKAILNYATESWNERTVSIEKIASTSPYR